MLNFKDIRHLFSFSFDKGSLDFYSVTLSCSPVYMAWHLSRIINQRAEPSLLTRSIYGKSISLKPFKFTLKMWKLWRGHTLQSTWNLFWNIPIWSDCFIFLFIFLSEEFLTFPSNLIIQYQPSCFLPLQKENHMISPMI